MFNYKLGISDPWATVTPPIHARDLGANFASKASAPRHMWDKAFTQESTLDVGMPS